MNRGITTMNNTYSDLLTAYTAYVARCYARCYVPLCFRDWKDS